jgi:sphingomyelin phosphodiesterase acid-like 3
MDPLYNSPNSFYHCCSDAHHNNCPGPFGKYGCDPPRKLLESALAYAKQIDPEPEFVLFNGDLTGHHLGSPDLTLQTIADGYKMIRDTFPGKLIIPTIGNCETFPDYQIGCGSDTTQYGITLKQLYDVWAPSLQGEQQAGPFQAGGYYYVLPSPGIRVIILNTILYSLRATHSSEADPCGQFEWLENQLALAEKKQETVYLISHVVPGVVSWENSNKQLDSAFSPFWVDRFWERYRELILKYSGLIETHMFGHAHRDYFRLMGDKPFGGSLPEQAQISIAMQELPAISPVRFNNPAFRRYYRSQQKPYPLLTYEQYYLDLEEANAGKPTWRLEYDFAKEYSETNLSAKAYANVYAKIKQQPKLYNRWFNHRQSQATDVATVGVQAEFLYTCSMTQFSTDDYSACTKANAPSHQVLQMDFDNLTMTPRYTTSAVHAEELIIARGPTGDAHDRSHHPMIPATAVTGVLCAVVAALAIAAYYRNRLIVPRAAEMTVPLTDAA